MPVDLQVAVEPAPDIAIQNLDAAVTALLAVTGDERLQGEICVRICDEDESRQLNTLYRNIDKPTNVLSFPADDGVHREVGLLGDLAVCWPVVTRQAQDQDKTVGEHFAHLFVHGVLHLLGFDHENDEEAVRMEAVEVRSLAQLGISDPYEPCQ